MSIRTRPPALTEIQGNRKRDRVEHGKRKSTTSEEPKGRKKKVKFNIQGDENKVTSRGKGGKASGKKARRNATIVTNSTRSHRVAPGKPARETKSSSGSSNVTKAPSLTRSIASSAGGCNVLSLQLVQPGKRKQRMVDLIEQAGREEMMSMSTSTSPLQTFEQADTSATVVIVAPPTKLLSSFSSSSSSLSIVEPTLAHRLSLGSYLTSEPFDITKLVFDYLTPFELHQCSMVCKSWQQWGVVKKKVAKHNGRWDINNNLKAKEIKFQVKHFLKKQPEVTPLMRAVLHDWLIQVNNEFDNNLDTQFIALRMVDKYLDLAPRVPRKEVQLIGVACLLIASKLEETHYPDLGELLYLCQNIYLRQDLLNKEREVLHTLGHTVHIPTVSHFMKFLLEEHPMTPLANSICMYWTELSVFSVSMAGLRQSKLAMAIYAAVAVFQNQSYENALMLSGYEKNDLSAAARALQQLLEIFPKADQGTCIYEKFILETAERAAEHKPTEDFWPALFKQLWQPIDDSKADCPKEGRRVRFSMVELSTDSMGPPVSRGRVPPSSSSSASSSSSSSSSAPRRRSTRKRMKRE